MSTPLRSDVAVFAGDSPRTLEALMMISAPESLTDDLVEHLLTRDDQLPHRWVESFIDAVHLCDFVIERNSEWHLAPTVRSALHEQLLEKQTLGQDTHAALLELSEPDAQIDDLELPRYLTHEVGRSYHGAFCGDEHAVKGYSAIATQQLSGLQWLANRLASEQVRLGVLRGDQIEVLFLQGMLHVHEGHWSRAEPLLRRVAESEQVRPEVAVAAHLVGQHDARAFSRRDTGIGLLRRSLAINGEIGDRFHAGQVMHTLAQALVDAKGHDREAEQLLRESAEIEVETQGAESWSVANQTLGALLGRTAGREDEGAELLARNLEIARRDGDLREEAQTLHLLGQLVGRLPASYERAERMLRRSLELKREVDTEFEVASVQHTLAQLIAKDPSRRKEALSLYEDSLETGRKLRRLNHQAQVLRSMALLPGTDRAVARRWLEESLEINTKIRNSGGVRIVKSALAALDRAEQGRGRKRRKK